MDTDIELKKYEIGYLVREEHEEREIKELLKSYGAGIINEGKLQKIRLSYPIKKETVAYFGYVYFSLSPESIKDLSSQLKLNSKVLRTIIINLPKELEEGQVATRRPEKPTRERIKLTPETIRKPKALEAIDNELLEKKLEEILK